MDIYNSDVCFFFQKYSLILFTDILSYRDDCLARSWPAWIQPFCPAIAFSHPSNPEAGICPALPTPTLHFGLAMSSPSSVLLVAVVSVVHTCLYRSESSLSCLIGARTMKESQVYIMEYASYFLKQISKNHNYWVRPRSSP